MDEPQQPMPGTEPTPPMPDEQQGGATMSRQYVSVEFLEGITLAAILLTVGYIYSTIAATFYS